MNAALQVDHGRYELRDVPVPEITDTQCLIEVKACALCATDVKYFKGLQTRAWPSPMGHEVAGVIAKVGANVEGFEVGERVWSRIVWGGFAEYVPSDADMLMRLPDTVGIEEGAIAQLRPIAVRGAGLAIRAGQPGFASRPAVAGLVSGAGAEA